MHVHKYKLVKNVCENKYLQLALFDKLEKKIGALAVQLLKIIVFNYKDSWL